MVAHAFDPRTWEAEAEAEAGGFLSSRPAWSTQRNPVLKNKTKQKKRCIYFMYVSALLLSSDTLEEYVWLYSTLTARPQVLSSIPSNHMVAHSHL